MLQGVDTSVHQGPVSETAMKTAGVDFRYIKLSEGGDFRDALGTADKVADIRRAGMIPGGYHYLRVRATRTGAQEMDFALRVQKSVGLGKAGDLRLAIDIEDRVDMTRLGAAKTRRYLVSAINHYRTIMGHFPVLYTFPSFFTELMQSASAEELRTIKQCPLWIAHFGVTRPVLPRPFEQSAIWQKSAEANVGGEHPVDFNIADPVRFKAALVGPRKTPVAPSKDRDIADLQRTLNHFRKRWLCDSSPLMTDGVKGPSTNRAVMQAKFYLGYGAKRTGAADSEFIRRVRHPRSLRFNSARRIALGIKRRRQLRKSCRARPNVPGFQGAVLYDGKPVPEWTVHWLDRARNYKGPGGPWRGVVVSGIRTPARSVQLCREMCGASVCPGRCAGLGSNHNATPPVTRCEGALDVSDFIRFGQIMRAIGAPLRNALPNDLVHYSCSGS